MQDMMRKLDHGRRALEIKVHTATAEQDAALAARIQAEEAEQQKRCGRMTRIARRVGLVPRSRTRVHRRPLRHARRRGAGRPRARRVQRSSAASGDSPGEPGELPPHPRQRRGGAAPC